MNAMVELIWGKGEGIEGKAAVTSRQRWVSDLVDRLRTIDRLAANHIPVAMLENMNDEMLLPFLDNIYRHPYFVVEKTEAIDRYAIQGDRVIKKGEYKEVYWKIEKGKKGKVQKVKDEDTVIVKFDNLAELFKVPVSDLVATKDKFFRFVPRLYSEVPLKLQSAKNWDAYFVRYESETPLEKIKVIIPDKAEGLLTATVYDRNKKNLYAITWANCEGLMYQFYSHYHSRDDGTHFAVGFEPSCLLPADQFKLVIPNTIDFKKLVEEAQQPYIIDGVLGEIKNI